MKYIALPVIWLLFWLAGIVAPLASVLWALARWRTRPISDAFHAQNRVAATLLGFEGDETISSECGKSTCRGCRWLCAVLSRVLENRHCEREAGR